MVHRFDLWVLTILLVPWSLLVLGFFGEQAVRLLRESWDGLIKADPTTGEIRPHGATALAQELYAMLDDGIPQTQNAPVTFNQGGTPALPGPVPITVNNPHGGDGILLNRGGITLKSDRGDIVLKDGDVKAPVSHFTDSNVDGGFYYWNGVPLDMAGKTSVFLGKVVSGTGDTYKVDLYGNGTKHAATVKGVTVTIPQIDPSEKINPGTVLGAVHKFGSGATATYESQPPVWLL